MATTQVLPREVRLVPPPTVPQARSYLFKQQSTQGNYTAGSNTPIQINIPRLQRSYLSKDSYLKFRLKVTNSTANSNKVYFDQPGAFGLFNRIEIYDYLGSTLLESIDGTNVLMSLLMNTSVNELEKIHHYNVCTGMQEDDSYLLHNGTAADTFTHEFSIPLFSFLGMLSSKFAPLHNGYTIMLTMETPKNFARFDPSTGAFSDTTTAKATLETNTNSSNFSFEINNVYFCAQILELGPVAESMLLSSSQGSPLIVNSKAFRHYTNTVPASSSNVRVDLNLNVASLTNVMFTQRDQTVNGWAGVRSLSQFVRNYLESWYFQYGSSILPQTQGISCRPPSGQTIKFYGSKSGTTNSWVGGSSEAYLELLKSRHSLNSSNFDGLIDQTNFNVDDIGGVFSSGVYVPSGAAANTAGVNSTYYPWDSTVTDGPSTVITNANFKTFYPMYGKSKFACGLDLEVVSGKSGDLVCGMNTNGMNTSIMMNFDATKSTYVKATTVDVWCEYDSFINISPGIATTVSF